MKEQYISLETAKLAKEKKVHIEGCCEVYSQEGGAARTPNGGKWNWEEYDKSEFCLRPTQSLLARWLREKCGKNIYVVMGNSERYIVWIQDIHSLAKVKITNFFDTYEYAMEEGLQQALKLIN